MRDEVRKLSDEHHAMSAWIITHHGVQTWNTILNNPPIAPKPAIQMTEPEKDRAINDLCRELMR